MKESVSRIIRKNIPGRGNRQQNVLKPEGTSCVSLETSSRPMSKRMSRRRRCWGGN